MDRINTEKILQTDTAPVQYDAVKAFLDEHNNLADYHFLYNRIYSRKNTQEQLIKTAVLSSFTIEQIKELLAVETYKYGIRSDIYIGGYNRYETEILDKTSELYEFSPDCLILAVRLEELFPDFHCRFLKLQKQDIEAAFDAIIDKYKNLIDVVKSTLKNTHIIIHNFTYPLFLEEGFFDFQDINGQTEYINLLNRRLKNLVNTCSGCYIFDINYYLYEFGAARAYDDKMWFMARNPFSKDFLKLLACRHSRFIKTIFGKRKKCLVLDADNTLWGGIIGEDGINGIELGNSYPANVYRRIQQTAKQYSNQGTILALNSKNNIEDIKEVFDKHPDMLLKWDDFAAVRANWNNKAENLLQIADELNIGIDSLVFVDDNPFEIEMIKQSYPEVQTVQFTDNVLHNLTLLENLDAFQSMRILGSDLEKTQQYRDNIKRTRVKISAASLEDFYRTLQTKAAIRLCSELDIKRLAQLTQKTNQFNLTTRRYTEADIERFSRSENYHFYTLRLQDRFGDNGLTGAVVIRIEKANWHIDTFLLSCRIIGRTAETALLSFITRQAKDSNAKTLTAEFIPTAKNKLVENFYQKHGFVKNKKLWTFELAEKNIETPEWIELV